MRITVTTVLLLLCATPVMAQVAAPSLMPSTARVYDPELWNNTLSTYGTNTITQTDAGFTTENPATMQWGRSEIGLGQFDSELTLEESGVTSSADFSGAYYGLRWVTQWFSVAREQVNWEGSSVNNGDYDSRHTSTAVALNLFDVLAIGHSQSDFQQDFFFTPILINFDIRREVSLTGVSVRFWDALYVGYSTGEEFDRFERIGSLIEITRDVRNYGIGLSTTGDTRWHLEWSHAEKDVGFQIDTSMNSEEDDQIVLEGQFGGLVVSLIQRDHLSSRNLTGNPPPGGNVFSESADSQVIGLAWIAGNGLTVAATHERVEIQVDANPSSKDVATTTVALGYTF